jgi:hypothetical protein
MEADWGKWQRLHHARIDCWPVKSLDTQRERERERTLTTGGEEFCGFERERVRQREMI